MAAIDTNDPAFYRTQRSPSRTQKGNDMVLQPWDIPDDIRSNRRELFADLAGLPDEHLNLMTRWAYGPTDARYMTLRFSDHEEEHGLQIEHTLRSMLGWQPTHVQLILASAERTRGDLLAALVGLGDDDLDVAPIDPEGEWPLRKIMVHLIATEHSYRINTLHAVEQYRKGEPHGDLPARGDTSAWENLSFGEMLTELDAARNRSMAELAGLPDDVLPAPAVWSGLELDVNFRLMRFSHHEREHAAHIRKWRVQTGKHQSDIQRLLGLAWQTHGVLRGLLAGVPQELYSRDPGNGEWSVEQALNHIRDADDFFHRQIKAAT